MAKPILTAAQMDQALDLARELWGTESDLLAACAELVRLRELHRHARKVLRGPIAFVLCIESLPEPGDAAAWVRAVNGRAR